jgi:trans-aconitate methyltransferase
MDSTETADEQELVNSHFDKAASYWAQVYERNDDLQSLFFQKRLRILLELVKRVGLAPQECFDVGCGPGHTTVAFAKRGYVVDTIDSIQVMVDATRGRALKANVECRVRRNLGAAGLRSLG